MTEVKGDDPGPHLQPSELGVLPALQTDSAFPSAPMVPRRDASLNASLRVRREGR